MAQINKLLPITPQGPKVQVHTQLLTPGSALEPIRPCFPPRAAVPPGDTRQHLQTCGCHLGGQGA